MRMTENIHGEVVGMVMQRRAGDVRRVKIAYKRTRGKGQVVREFARCVPLAEIIPADEADQAQGIHWRLQYFLQEGRGKAVAGNVSPHNSSKTSRKPWTPYTPDG